MVSLLSPTWKPKKKHKYNAKPFRDAEGRYWASSEEAKYYEQLLWLKYVGEIDELEKQPRFALWVEKDGKRTVVTTYVADFSYKDIRTGRHIVCDVKGYETDVFKLKRKWFELLYGDRFELQVIKAKAANKDAKRWV